MAKSLYTYKWINRPLEIDELKSHYVHIDIVFMSVYNLY